ncbi:MAG: metallophosphoesterase [Desulfobacterales bacterium]|nr:MAG: metallophosphoesterase [Desulfobacterales bacterium]
MRLFSSKKISRRSFLKHGVRLSALAFLGIGYERRNDLRTEHVSLGFTNLPDSFHGFRIVQISDLHASYWVGRDYLMEVVREINKLKKDLVVITGDIITGSVNSFWKRWLPAIKGDYLSMVVDVLGNLDEGDKMAVLGNHDQWDGKKTELRLVSELERIGIRVLRNSSEKLVRGLSSLYVAGTDDYWSSCNLEKALRNVPQNEFKILLCHSPDVRQSIKNGSKIDITLCGHTHGGQVAIPFISHHFIPIKDPLRYQAGLIKEPYGYTYVNRGIGTLVFPFRVAAPPEISCFTLQKL